MLNFEYNFQFTYLLENTSRLFTWSGKKVKIFTRDVQLNKIYMLSMQYRAMAAKGLFDLGEYVVISVDDNSNLTKSFEVGTCI